MWDKVFKNGPSKTCGRQPLENLKGYGLLKQTTSILEYFVPYISYMLTHDNAYPGGADDTESFL